MTITYILQVLEDMAAGKPNHADDVVDMNGELQKAVLRVRKHISRLKTRAQYELGEMDKAKVRAASGHMEEFTKGFARIEHFNLKDCTGLSGIENFLKEGFRVEDMISRADKIASLSTLGGNAYSSMELGFGILDTFTALPAVKIDNNLFHAQDKAYLEELIRNLKDYQQRVRDLTSELDKIGHKAREEADCMNDLADYFIDGIDDLDHILDERGVDWNNYTHPEKMQIGRTIQVAQMITLLFPHLLGEDGKVSKKSEEAIEIAKKALSFRDA